MSLRSRSRSDAGDRSDQDRGRSDREGPPLPSVAILNPNLLQRQPGQAGPTPRTPTEPDDDSSTPLDDQTPAGPYEPLPIPVVEFAPAPVSGGALGDVLPGTTINFEAGLRAFKDGVAFGMTPEGTVTFGGSISVLIIRYGNLRTPEVNRLNKGQYNEFFQFRSDVELEILRVTRHDSGSKVGMRRMKFDKRVVPEGTRYENHMREQWTEAWIGLKAAAAGIGPKIYAVGMTETYLAVTMMERGDGELRDFIDDRYSYEDGLALAQPLQDLMTTAASIGLVMADIKSENIIVMAGNQLRFIDFDPGFTALVDASAECVEFINMFMLTSNLLCWMNTDATSGLTSTIRSRMAVLLPRLKASNGSDLCGIFLSLSWNNSARRTWLSKLVLERPELVAKHFLYMAGHYLGWWTERGGYACSRSYDYSEGAPPIVEQIAQKIMVAMERTR